LHIGPQLTLAAQLVPDANKGKVEVKYSLSSGALSAADWVGLYPAAEKNNRAYLAITYLKPIAPGSSESVTFDAPRTPGDYVLRFFPKKCKYTHVASSNRLRVENRDLLLAEEVKDAKTGRLLSLKVRAEVHSVEPSTSDYVALYRVGASNNSYLTYAYYDRTKAPVELAAPTEVADYEVRFHAAAQSKYSDVCRSRPIHVQNTDWVKAEASAGLITVCWDVHSVAKTKWDWIGLFAKDAPNTKYLEYKYIDVNSTALTFDVRAAPGAYEARYFSASIGKYTDFRKSAAFHVA